ncbi:aminotransferase class III-fold pyridoxal phosphate-dependent enzyme [Nonomuraea sp. SYSU D8015]|uniref:aminotransferase class III-fold pyridoxal phosphate-dependent enzyme n=1 Tax=Nonomuraea sp. SYSU D8015 TaxID=2593644 RepID=UPI0016615EBF|nr:aminotransferase class III-fold pyridoxal phosphate-dependent enzyme [Nonomuraea sp. SYSU D8015]
MARTAARPTTPLAGPDGQASALALPASGPAFERASGAQVWDTQGRCHVDLSSCSGAAPLGAGYRPVVAAAIAELERGGVLPEATSPLREEVARRVVEIFPCAQSVEFFRTGSCATTAAVRLARLHTGARTVLTSGYHGWHDWQLQYRPEMALPERDPDTADFGYDLDVLDRLIRRRGDLAAVIVTPEVNVFPPAFAREVERVTRAHGGLLIVDEVMTGFRYAWGGYHAAAGVHPDLITLSKGLANGFALSAVAGDAEVMAAARRTHLGNTYQRETTPFAAALATLDASAGGAAIAAMRAAGERLMHGLDRLFEQASVAAWARSWPTMFDVVFADPEQGRRFFAALRESGYPMAYGQRFMPSAALTDDDISGFLDTAARVLPDGGPRPRGEGTEAAVRYAADHFAATRETVERWWPAPA